MAETRITNVIVPEVFDQYTSEKSIYQSAFYRSGAVQVDTNINAKLAGGGKLFTLPTWKDIAGTSGDIPVEGTDATVNALTTGEADIRRQYRVKAWGSSDLAGVFAGDKPIDAAMQMVNNYWAQAYDQVALKTLYGVIVDDIANDSSSITNTTTASFSLDGVLDTQALVGENQEGFSVIVMHPVTYAKAKKLNAIDFVKESEQGMPVPTYAGMKVIVSRNATLVSTTYTTYMLKPGAFKFGENNSIIIPTELDRDSLLGGGTDYLITRRNFAMHPAGFSFLEGSVAGVSPTDAELILDANWNKIWNAEACGIVAYQHTA